MTTPELKQKAADMLLKELKTGVREWYYISVAGKEFYGGFFIHAFGPTDAWMLLHKLNLYPAGSNYSTQTHGPIENETMDEKIPEDKRWVRLFKFEIDKLS